MGLQLRINSSKTEYFQESVEQFSKAFAMSGYNYQESKKKLRVFEKEQPSYLIKRRRQTNKYLPECRVYFINKYDPRVPHPRKLLSRNYHLIAKNPVLPRLFPRQNLVAGSLRLPNLGEILSPTVQKGGAEGAGGGQGQGPGGAGGGERFNGTYHCDLFKRSQRCDVCAHMVERSYV